MYSRDLQMEIFYRRSKKRNRYDKRNAARKTDRLRRNRLMYPELDFRFEDRRRDSNSTKRLRLDTGLCNRLSNTKIGPKVAEDPIEASNSIICETFGDRSSSLLTTDNSTSDQEEPFFRNDRSQQQRLHSYVNMTTLSYCRKFVDLARRAHLCKSITNEFLYFLKDGLPVPNSMPSSEQELLKLLEVTNLFTRRLICLLCRREYSERRSQCSNCFSEDEKTLVFVYDVKVMNVMKHLLTKLSDRIDEYREQIISGDNSNSNDIPFGSVYQELLKKHKNSSTVSLLLHADGVSLTKSSKLKVWILSASVVELPPKLRKCAWNMIIMSIWVGYVEPTADIWLKNSVSLIQQVKESGIHVRNKKYEMKIIGVTGDCPALSIVNNFAHHNAYYSCWLCFIRGEHVNNKQQYPYREEMLRTPKDFHECSKKAEITTQRHYGHRGVSILDQILDVPLPNSIILDYLHVSLLGHGKNITLCAYNSMKPSHRKLFNQNLKQQKFPHFFSRKLKTMDNFSFVKGTEMRNLLFYGVAPHLRSFLSMEQYGHLMLYICGLHLLHSGHFFGDKTNLIAQQLFRRFHLDHQRFYNEMMSFKLHLHSHFSTIYERYGSLCHLGCFSQESMIGLVSENYHGTKNYGDSITYYYNIDFLLRCGQNIKQHTDGCFDVLNKSYIDDKIIDFHSSICSCYQIDKCCVLYQRCIVRQHIFHSLLYDRRKKSVSYFVQYISETSPDVTHFGIVEHFFQIRGLNYAKIRKHQIKHSFSEFLNNSDYYYALKAVVDRLYFVVEKLYVTIEIIPTESILKHCIVVEKDDHFVVSCVLSYDEHD